MNIKLIPLQNHCDDRGALVALEHDENIPFEIKRVYYIFNTLAGVIRGYHAHKKLKQFVIVVSGSCDFTLDDGNERVTISLNNPAQGLYIDSCIWREMANFTEDCVLLVLADNIYDENDYIRDYSEFLVKMKNEK
ncbi:dTDP-6-deoxy-3,4-keto-hexulose isomerase [Shewanella sp. c952]|uniref:sugar 3,4-ketoisomerase n=1 Tax=Shewanella sp. c952 TaxID=2815913 RepID=UPI001BB8ABA0|nr:FdtA/QdtA family cupin domain-containing protein [Shewanella sp. c952]GIU12378.1 dTDP-6-deoxy-3,4-keto-hexulose isomerase [Shewanella sp. c952]